MDLSYARVAARVAFGQTGEGGKVGGWGLRGDMYAPMHATHPRASGYRVWRVGAHLGFGRN